VIAADVATARLRGERPRPEHAAHYAELFGSDAVAATLWPAPHGGARSPEQARELLAADIEHWDAYGFGPWVLFEAATGRFAGHAGLKCSSVGDGAGVEVLYAIHPDLWGSGYATEIARAAVARARDLALTDVVGFTLTTNIASQRVLEKAGLRFERTLEHALLPHWFGRL
jgi:RimJ/RimL family protein N-acetyltransferase